jgi:hypothetical protein
MNTLATAITAIGLALSPATDVTSADARGNMWTPVDFSPWSGDANGAEEHAIRAQLEVWRRVWSAPAAEAAGFGRVYLAGADMERLAKRTGFSGQAIESMRIEGVVVSGETASSVVSVTATAEGVGSGTSGQRIVQVWRKADGQWRILHEQRSALAATPPRAVAF